MCLLKIHVTAAESLWVLWQRAYNLGDTSNDWGKQEIKEHLY